MAPFHILFGALFTVAVSMALGTLLLRGLGARLCAGEERLLALVTGAPLLSAAVFAICALGAARKSVFLWLGVAVLALAWRRGAHRGASERLPELPRFWSRLFWTVFAIFGTLYLVNAMAPEISPDGGTYHLGLVARYLREHGFHRITDNFYAFLSQGTEMLFLYAFAFGHHSSAALVHCAFLLALPLLMVCYGRRFGMPSAAACGALLVFASPVAGIDGTSAYNDVALAATAFALFYLLRVWDAQRQAGLPAAIGLLAGFGYAIKYTAVLGVPYALGFLAWRSYRKRQAVWRPVLAAGACAALMALPWMAKNWLWTGNPFAPFLNAVFPNPYVTVAFEHQYTAYLRSYFLPSLWQAPLAATVTGEKLGGFLGPVWLLAPLALLALRERAGRELLLAAAIFGLPYAGNIGTRFLLPPLPFVALALALAVTAWRAAAAALVVVHAALSLPPVTALYARQAWRLRRLPVADALRLRPEDEYLIAHKNDYAMARLIERRVPPHGKVFTVTGLPEAYTTRSVMVAGQSAEGQALEQTLYAAVAPERQPTWRLRFRFAPQPMRGIRVVETARDAWAVWTVAEMRVTPAPRRVTSNVNPWYVRRAFDGIPVTLWWSGRALAPGMYLEADFEGTPVVETVELDGPHDERAARLKLEAQQPGGAWTELPAALSESEGTAPPAWRRAAIEELKRHGIGYLMVVDADPYARDFREHAAWWGIRQVGDTGPMLLYELL